MRMLVTAGCGFVVACDAETGDGVESRDGTISCPPRQCGFNSAEVNGRSIRELNLDGQYNAADLKISGFLAPQGILGNYVLDVQDDELVAVDGNNVLRGNALIGATIFVTQKPKLSLLGLPILPLPVPVPITILGYQEIESWADGGDPVATYALVYPDPSSLLGSRNVCNDGLLDLLATTASVLGGETYDLEDKEVNAGMNRWFTIACPGSAADKLRMLGYGPQSDFDGTGLPATADQRQATLKMITADYCGDGDSYTANGTPLQWDNAAGSVAMEGPHGAVEAVWTEDGAVCLGTPRLVDREDVACDSLPTCTSAHAGEWITHLPPQ